MLEVAPLSDRAQAPTEAVLAEVLGAANGLWNNLIAAIQSVRDVRFEWKKYGKAASWTLRILQKRRALLYLYPNQGSFEAVFIYGPKAVALAEQADLPAPVLESIRNATPYVEGRGFRVPVRQQEDIATVLRLVEIKVGS